MSNYGTPNSLVLGRDILSQAYNPQFTPDLNIFNTPPMYMEDIARQMQNILQMRMMNLYKMLGGL